MKKYTLLKIILSLVILTYTLMAAIVVRTFHLLMQGSEKEQYFGVVQNTYLAMLAIFIFLIISIVVCIEKGNQHLANNVKMYTYGGLAGIYASMYIWDLENNTYEIVNTSDRFTGKSSEKILNASEYIRDIISEVVCEDYMKDMLAFVDYTTLEDRMYGKKTITQEFLRNNDVWCRARLIREDDVLTERVKRVIFAIELIDEQKRRENELRELSEKDIMTGVHNRGAGEKEIRDLMESGESGLFCLLDVDSFKSINDKYGHTVGDQVIIAVSESLKRSFGKKDVIMRLGGDEFAVFAISEKELSKSHEIVDRLFQEIDNMQIPDMGNCKTTISVGVTYYDGSFHDDFDKVYKRTDMACYESKKREGNYATYV